MPLSQKEIERLLRVVGLTKEREIDCDQCLLQVAEFAELELADKSVPEGLAVVAHHLSVCAECHEEYQLLQRALETMEPSDGGSG